eukprot:638527-Pelagomonas_calceolata.AAC.1
MNTRQQVWSPFNSQIKPLLIPPCPHPLLPSSILITATLSTLPSPCSPLHAAIESFLTALFLAAATVAAAAAAAAAVPVVNAALASCVAALAGLAYAGQP